MHRQLNFEGSGTFSLCKNTVEEIAGKNLLRHLSHGGLGFALDKYLLRSFETLPEAKKTDGIVIWQKSCIFAGRTSDIIRSDVGRVAQLNRASDYGSEGYRFESCRGHSL